MVQHERLVAELVILSEGKAITRRGNVRQRVTLDTDETRLGTGKYDCDLLLLTEGDNSCPLDDLHCVIYYDYDAAQYFLLDNYSTYGTLLNEAPVVPEQPVPLNSGDNIELSRVRYGGVLLRFFILEAQQTASIDETQPGPALNL